MITSIYKLGKLYVENENLTALEILSEMPDNTPYVINIELDIDNNNLSYNRVYQTEFDTLNYHKYLYKFGSSNGVNITPSAIITGLPKTWDKKFFKWFEIHYEENKLYNDIYNCLKNNCEKIVEDISNVYENIISENKKVNVLLSLLIIDQDGNINYLKDFDEFKESLVNSVNESYKKSSKSISSGEGLCYLCDEKKEVNGFTLSRLHFYFSTSDKLGPLPDKNIKNTWKSTPVCNDCALYLDAGRQYVEKYLTFYDSGLNYYVIPKFNGCDIENFNKINKIVKLGKGNTSEDLNDLENKLSWIVEDLEDTVEFKFIFYNKGDEKPQKTVLNILSSVESTIPSWLNKLFEEQLKISNMLFFQEDNLKEILNMNVDCDFISYLSNEKYIINKNDFYKKFLKELIVDNNMNNGSFKKYLGIVTDIINNKKINNSILFNFIVNKLQYNFRKDNMYGLKIDLIKSIMLLIFFNNVNILKGGNIMEKSDEFNIESMLNSPDKKASFLLGVLTANLLNQQWNETNGNKPFYNKLYGLQLDEKKLRKLYPKVINKLNEYKKNFYVNLEKEITINFVNSDGDWNLNRDETSFYFTLGLTLPGYSRKFNKNNNGGLEDE